jgi:hypothetical protein
MARRRRGPRQVKQQDVACVVAHGDKSVVGREG